MSSTHLRRDYAAALLSDLEQSSATFMPRREAIGDWLRNYVRPTGGIPRAADDNDVPNLLAINEHLRAHAVAGGVRPILN